MNKNRNFKEIGFNGIKIIFFIWTQVWFIFFIIRYMFILAIRLFEYRKFIGNKNREFESKINDP